MIPLNVHTHYSLLQGYCKPKQLLELAKNFEYSSVGISDIDSLSGTINFMSEFEGSGIKTIIGTKIKLKDSGYIHLIAKNLNGWKELIYIYLCANASEDKSIGFEHLYNVKNLICITGDINSSIQQLLIAKNSVFTVQNPTQSLSFYLKDNYDSDIQEHLHKLQLLFKDDLYIGLQKCNTSIVIDEISASIFRSIADKMGIKTVALNNTYVHSDAELEEFQILISSNEKVKLSEISEKIQSESKANLYRFFNDKGFGLYNKSFYKQLYSEEEIKNLYEIESKIEDFSLLKNPETPDFICPNNLTQKEYLLELCRNGWSRVSPKVDQNRKQEYVDRIKYELDVINKIGLEGYFLIVQDYVNWARNQGQLIGCARGSSAGCLTSYLVGITGIDPIIYDLMFERFYNEGRNAPGKISFPDIDVDFPVSGREKVIQYIRNKYNSDNVAQIMTLQEIQGRSAIREVLKVYGACPQDFINEISKKLPQKAAIADKLEETKEKSIIKWTLENDPELLSDWCELKDGELVGEYSLYFKKAIQIEGTFKAYGKHASAVVITREPIAQICPMIKDKSSNELLAAIEYEELEKMGILKLDILGNNCLDKLMAANELLEFGKIINHTIEEETDEE